MMIPHRRLNFSTFSSLVSLVILILVTHSTDSLQPPFSKLKSLDLKHRSSQNQNSSSSRADRSLSHPTVYRCGEIGKDLVVNFVNKNYPDDDVSAGDCRFRLVISSPHVCQVRVDFVDTEMMAPVKGDCLSQMLEVEGPIWPTGLPPLCGTNNDQHFYLHLESWSANSSWVDFRLTTVVAGKPYRFAVWLTQIDCSNFNVLKAPEGCTQYYLGEKGAIKSFNFEGHRLLNGQDYKICIRSGKGVCGIRYEANDGDFGIRKSVIAHRDVQLRSGTGPAICGLDYMLIPDGRTSLVLNSRRKSRLLFRRRTRPPNIIYINAGGPPPKSQPAAPPPPPPPPPTTTTTTSTTTLSSVPSSTLGHKLLKKIQKPPELKTFFDRFCGGILSPNGGEAISRPVLARVRSNLIMLHLRTATTYERKLSKRNNLLNMTTGFRIFYNQLRECEDRESDMAQEPNLLHMIHSQNIGMHEFNPPLLRDEIVLGPDSHPMDTFMTPSGSQIETSTMSDEESIIKKQGTTEATNSNSTSSDTDADITDDDSLWDYLDDGDDDSGMEGQEEEGVEEEEDDEEALYDL